MRHPCTPRRLDPTADRDRRCQARQAPEETPGRIASRKRRSSASSTGSQGPQRKRVCTEVSPELSALLLTQLSHEAYRLPKETRRRSPLIPHPKKTRRFRPSSSEPTATKITEPNPLSNSWKTLCQIRLWNLFKQNPPVATALARLPIDPVSDLNEVFPPTSAEFVPKGTPIDPGRQSPWADSWGPRPSTSEGPFRSDWTHMLLPIRYFGDHPALKHGVSTKFRTAVLAAAAVPVVSAHDLTGSYMVSWSELEQVCFEERKEIAQGVRMLRSFDEVGADLSALWYSISKTAGFG
ncbi:hypothetical protein B0H14DRAFT_3150425 [Mycena olivaceomarginata]|nr:hypothetical protein B0H14DRAFT_3150425 [Mycena olivaceomarginata]